MDTLMQSFLTYFGIGLVITAFAYDWEGTADEMRQKNERGELKVFPYIKDLLRWIFLWPIILIMIIF